MGDLKGSSEYPLKRIWIFKGLSVRPSIGYPLIHILTTVHTKFSVQCRNSFIPSPRSSVNGLPKANYAFVIGDKPTWE